MSLRTTLRILALALPVLGAAAASRGEEGAGRLAGALLGPTPLEEDLRYLTDEIGGRPTGSEANLRSVEWGLERFRDAGVEVRKEPFEMPVLWLEKSASAVVRGDDVTFSPAIAAMPFSTATPPEGSTAPLVDGGTGEEADFARLGEAAKGAFVLVETPELLDVPGLFEEYTHSSEIEGRAFAAGVAGVAYMGSRASGALYRHNASLGPKNDRPMLVMERDGARRALRLLRTGESLRLEVHIELQSGGPYESYNVIGEIRGTATPEEFVVVGAHLDSWGIGNGALDNGCNVALVIDLARQMKRLGLTPRRTIRFALWNGEEQGIFGSWGYVKRHRDELDRHVMASSFDIGSGRINGFYTGGRPEIVAAVEKALEPVRGLGPFDQVDAPVVGTDNYDFMMEGVANLVANQESANYGPNYHARSDTFDKVDLVQLRLNASVAGAVVWGFAEMDAGWKRQTRAEIQHLIDSTDLGEQMRSFALWDSWESGERGRQD